MIGHKRIPSREGGIEVVVEELSIRLAKLGHKVTAYNRKGHHVSGKEFDDRSSNDQLKEYKKVRIETVPTIEGKGFAALTSSFLGTLEALFGHYDCIHYHAEGPSVMLVIPHIFRIRTIVTIHGLDWQRSKWGGFAAWYLKLGEKIAARYADEVIVLSKNVQQYFKDTYGRETIFIPNGISKPEIKETELIEKQWKLKKDEYILFLGRIVPEKGIQYLIDAYKNVNTSKKLIIAGGSSDTDTFMSEIKEKAKSDDRIIFTGFVEGEVLQQLYSNAYTYVLPSDLEGMPISLLEAMSYGNCCVVSDIPECTEVVQDKAVVFKKGNICDLKEKLEWLCDNYSIVNKYKAEASNFICNKYSWDDVVLSTIQLYRN
ncbi:glycosyltransferase family 4 protein [Clostridium sp. PL3]|uniref:Glycosyltransferase family 4 protein n=2 Tax=Clostridium thailandense TaxID=2794346 RepID=A0A949X2N2_9CLOT|nr:glycosyltransferase family 4 protein [Clostridium thailandense]